MRLVLAATLLASCGSPPPSPPMFTPPTLVRPDASVPDAPVAATDEECARACKVERACEGTPIADAEISEPQTCVSCATMEATVVRCIAAATCDTLASCTPPFVWPYGDGDDWRDELR